MVLDVWIIFKGGKRNTHGGGWTVPHVVVLHQFLVLSVLLIMLIYSLVIQVCVNVVDNLSFALIARLSIVDHILQGIIVVHLFFHVVFLFLRDLVSESFCVVVLIDLILVHVQRLNFLCCVLVLTNSVHIDLILINVVHNKITWVQPNDSFTIRLDFNGKHYRPVLHVDESRNFGKGLILHFLGKFDPVNLMTHSLGILRQPS